MFNGFCLACVDSFCETGEGDRVGLPFVPPELIDDAILWWSRHLDTVGDFDEHVLECEACLLLDDICRECDEEVPSIERDDEWHVICHEYVLIGCEGYHTPALRYAALQMRHTV